MDESVWGSCLTASSVCATTIVFMPLTQDRDMVKGFPKMALNLRWAPRDREICVLEEEDTKVPLPSSVSTEEKITNNVCY